MKIDELKTKIEILQATVESMEVDGLTRIIDEDYYIELSDLKPVVAAAGKLAGLVHWGNAVKDVELSFDEYLKKYGCNYQSAHKEFEKALRAAEEVD